MTLVSHVSVLQQVFTTLTTPVLCQVCHVVRCCVSYVVLSCVLCQACDVVMCVVSGM